MAMSALWMIARHEVLRALRHRTARAGMLALGALVLAGCLLGAYRQVLQSRERQAYQELVRRQWEEQPARHPHRVAHYGSFAFRPTSALAFFDPGVDSFVGTTVYLEAHRRNGLGFSEVAQSGELLRLGTASTAFVLQLLLPLLVFCLAFGSVAGEREGGTWRLLLAQGVSPRALMAGKVLGVWLLVALLLVPSLLLVALVALGTGAFVPTADTVARALLLVAAYALYGLLCAALAVWVSSWHAQARGALLTLMVLWMGLWLVVPRVATHVAAQLHPSPSGARFDAELEQALRGAADGHSPNSPAFQALKDRYLREYGVERVEDLPINFGGVAMHESEAATRAVFEDHYRRLFDTWRAQDRAALVLSLLNPLLALRNASMALSGTDAYHVIDFEQQAEDHRYAFVQRLNELHTQEIHFENDRAQRLDASKWREFPPFEYRPPSLGQSMAHAGLAAASLLGWVVALLAAALGARPGGVLS
jgi:ABC-2 type transport system permease protein